ncbi:MAG: hypothetical protein M3463_16555 [Verrucomicrobiota bacterium]|nr:hypothetical protein [Verrucomicrobiota bacterium]
MNRFSYSSSRRLATRAAFTLLEVLLAVGLSLIAVNGIMLLSSMCLRLVKSARQSNAATFSLQERIEQLRTAPWNGLTNASYLSDKIFAAAPLSAAPLGNLTESITLSAYPTADASATTVVERLPDGTTRVFNAGTTLGTQRLARFQVRLTWNGSDSRQCARETVTIVSKGGVGGFNVPSMGADSSGNGTGREKGTIGGKAGKG